MSERLDYILKQALTPDQKPDLLLNRKILNQIKGKEEMKIRKRKWVPGIVFSLVFILAAGSGVAYAAYKLLNAEEAAEKAGDEKLARAFSGEDALEYAYILSDQKSSGSAYVGSRARQWIREEKIPDVEEAEGKICIRGTWFQLEEEFPDHVLPLDCFDQPLKTENSIILSVEELPVIGEEANVQCVMTIGNHKGNGSFAEKLLQDLNEKYGEEYSFYFSNQQYEKEYLVEYLSLIPGYLGKVAVILIFIMAVGYAGILKLFFLKRMSELAICSACGASYKSLVKEVILEIGAICLGGCVIGMGAGTILTETVELGLPVRPDIRSYLIALVLALAMTFLQSGLVLLPLKRDSIYAALRETGK